MILLSFLSISPFLISKITISCYSFFSQLPQYASLFTMSALHYLLPSTSLTSPTNTLPLADNILAILVFLLILKCIKCLSASCFPEKRHTPLVPGSSLHRDPLCPPLFHCERSALASTESYSPPCVLPPRPSRLIMQFHPLTPAGPLSLSDHLHEHLGMFDDYLPW